MKCIAALLIAAVCAHAARVTADDDIFELAATATCDGNYGSGSSKACPNSTYPVCTTNGCMTGCSTANPCQNGSSCIATVCVKSVTSGIIAKLKGSRAAAQNNNGGTVVALPAGFAQINCPATISCADCWYQLSCSTGFAAPGTTAFQTAQQIVGAGNPINSQTLLAMAGTNAGVWLCTSCAGATVPVIEGNPAATCTAAGTTTTFSGAVNACCPPAPGTALTECTSAGNIAGVALVPGAACPAPPIVNCAKGSPKGLLGLLGLLGLIPLLLCLLCLCLLLLRRKKREQDVHFATFDAAPASAALVPPTAALPPPMPIGPSFAAPCAAPLAAPCGSVAAPCTAGAFPAPL